MDTAELECKSNDMLESLAFFWGGGGGGRQCW